MPRLISKVAPEWWDYTTLEEDLLADAAKLTAHDLEQLSRPGFEVRILDTLEEFYLTEALEYIHAWQRSTPDNPAGICGPTARFPVIGGCNGEATHPPRTHPSPTPRSPCTPRPGSRPHSRHGCGSARMRTRRPTEATAVPTAAGARFCAGRRDSRRPGSSRAGYEPRA